MLFLHHRGDLLHVHLEAAVARDGPDRLAGASQHHAHRRGHREPHGPQSAGGDVGVGPLIAEQLGDPHLVLAHVGDDRAAARGVLLEGGQDPVRRQPALEALHPRPDEALDLRAPRRRTAGARRPRAGAERGPGVADEAHGHGHVLPDLRGVELDVNDLGAAREGRQVAGDPVVEPEADPDDEVGLLDGAVHVHLAVHAGHAEMQRVRLGKGADAEQRRDDRDAGALGQLAELAVGVAQDDAVARHDQRPLGPRDEPDRLDERQSRP